MLFFLASLIALSHGREIWIAGGVGQNCHEACFEKHGVCEDRGAAEVGEAELRMIFEMKQFYDYCEAFERADYASFNPMSDTCYYGMVEDCGQTLPEPQGRLCRCVAVQCSDYRVGDPLLEAFARDRPTGVRVPMACKALVDDSEGLEGTCERTIGEYMSDKMYSWESPSTWLDDRISFAPHELTWNDLSIFEDGKMGDLCPYTCGKCNNNDYIQDLLFWRQNERNKRTYHGYIDGDTFDLDNKYVFAWPDTAVGGIKVETRENSFIGSNYSVFAFVAGLGGSFLAMKIYNAYKSAGEGHYSTLEDEQ